VSEIFRHRSSGGRSVSELKQEAHGAKIIVTGGDWAPGVTEARAGWRHRRSTAGSIRGHGAGGEGPRYGEQRVYSKLLVLKGG